MEIEKEITMDTTELLKQLPVYNLMWNDVLMIFPTDMAYEMLGVEKYEIYKNGACVDTIKDDVYIFALVKYINDRYQIEGLSRTSKGNSHDANWEEEIVIYKEDGVWKDLFDSKKEEKGGAFNASPLIIKHEKINDENLIKWSLLYDLSDNGEEFDSRKIYCTDTEGNRIAYLITYIYKDMNNNELNSPNYRICAERCFG